MHLKEDIGLPKITKVLNGKGINVSQKRGAKRMRILGLRSIVIKKYNHAGKSNTDDTKEYPNLLEQDFFAEKPSQKWGRYYLYLHQRNWMDLFSDSNGFI